MRCDRCGAYGSRADSHCQECGADLRDLRLPVKRDPVSPTLWQQAAPVLARGVGLVALGVAAEMALTALARGALRLPVRRPTKSKLPARRDGEMPEGTYAVSETVVMRRVTVRR